MGESTTALALQLIGLGGDFFNHDDVMANLKYFLRVAGAIPLCTLKEMDMLNSKVCTLMINKKSLDATWQGQCTAA